MTMLTKKNVEKYMKSTKNMKLKLNTGPHKISVCSVHLHACVCVCA